MAEDFFKINRCSCHCSTTRTTVSSTVVQTSRSPPRQWLNENFTASCTSHKVWSYIMIICVVVLVLVMDRSSNTPPPPPRERDEHEDDENEYLFQYVHVLKKIGSAHGLAAAFDEHQSYCRRRRRVCTGYGNKLLSKELLIFLMKLEQPYAVWRIWVLFEAHYSLHSVQYPNIRRVNRIPKR